LGKKNVSLHDKLTFSPNIWDNYYFSGSSAGAVDGKFPGVEGS
jgi:hypothetical protein